MRSSAPRWPRSIKNSSIALRSATQTSPSAVTMAGLARICELRSARLKRLNMTSVNAWTVKPSVSANSATLENRSPGNGTRRIRRRPSGSVATQIAQP